MSAKKKAAEDAPQSGMIQLTPYDLGFSWCSRLPEPDEYPQEVISAIETSFNAIGRFFEDHRNDPLTYYGHADSIPKNADVEFSAYCMAKVFRAIQKGGNLGSHFDKTKTTPTPIPTRRRCIYVWNQFTIRKVFKPGFLWFSDWQSAQLMQGLCGFPVSADDIKNDRRHYGIKKIPAKYRIDIPATLNKVEARRGTLG